MPLSQQLSHSTSNSVNIVDKDTVLCISLAARPSNHGVRFHNWLYAELGLNYLYKAVAPTDIAKAVEGIRGLGIRGAGVSMPYKQDVLELVDHVDHSASRIHAVNTIVNDDGVLTAYNTDYTAVATLIEDVDPSLTTIVRGSGGMANAVVAALADHGLRGTVASRNEETGRALAERYDWEWISDENVEPGGSARADLLVNVTPLGMSGDSSEVQSFSDEAISEAQIIFDVVAFPVETPLIQAAGKLGKPTINGGQVVALQAAEQFALYTGVTPTAEQVEEAELYSQQRR